MTEIFTARSVEEAKELAAKKFGKKISEIRFEIIDEERRLVRRAAPPKEEGTVWFAMSAPYCREMKAKALLDEM